MDIDNSDLKISCGIFVFDKTNRFIVGHPTNSPWDVWGIPKGLKDPGESYLEAAIRETYEETSLMLDINSKFKELPLIQYKNKNKAIKAFIYRHDYIIEESSLICTSMVTSTDKADFPEIDKYKMIFLDQAESYLRNPQIELIEYVNKFIDKQFS